MRVVYRWPTSATSTRPVAGWINSLPRRPRQYQYVAVLVVELTDADVGRNAPPPTRQRPYAAHPDRAKIRSTVIPPPA